MNFMETSGSWIVEAATKPKELLEAFFSGAIKLMPKDSLGHIKGYAEFSSGKVFASSTILPADINFKEVGDYEGGPVVVHVAFIFGDLYLDTLNNALENGESYLNRTVDCKLTRL